MSARNVAPVMRKCRNKAVLTHLKLLRESLGLDAETLAVMTNLSIFSIRAYEQGVRRPGPEGWRRIRQALTVWVMERFCYDRMKATEFVVSRLILVPVESSKPTSRGARRRKGS